MTVLRKLAVDEHACWFVIIFGELRVKFVFVSTRFFFSFLGCSIEFGFWGCELSH